MKKSVFFVLCCFLLCAAACREEISVPAINVSPSSTKPVTEKTPVMPTYPKDEYVCLEVANIMQNPSLPNGCEVVSLAIALNYAGYGADPVVLYEKYMPKSPYQNGDPWTSYVGNAKGIGYGCYAPCIVTTGNEYLSSINSSKKVIDVSGMEMPFYKRRIDEGIPVIFWGLIGMNGNSRVCWEADINGKNVKWHSYSHCMVLIGYTSKTYIFCDPLKGVTEYGKADVEASFSINYRQACIIE